MLREEGEAHGRCVYGWKRHLSKCRGSNRAQCKSITHKHTLSPNIVFFCHKETHTSLTHSLADGHAQTHLTSQAPASRTKGEDDAEKTRERWESERPLNAPISALLLLLLFSSLFFLLPLPSSSFRAVTRKHGTSCTSDLSFPAQPLSLLALHSPPRLLF